MGTQEDIIERINERLTIEANTVEGGFSQNIIGSVAYELANIYDVQLPDILKNGFISTADEEHLILKGNEWSLPRKSAVKSIVYLEITGTVGTFISTSVQAQYDNLVFTVTDTATIGSTGKATVKAQCETAGTIGNVDANTITKFVTDYSGLTAVTNPASAYDGVDEEELETYRARLLEYISEDASNANKEQYKQWALSVSGVQKVVIQGAESEGAGNVGVYISSTTGTVSDELKEKVKDYIESVQPINATIIVNELTTLAINVVSTVTLKSGYTTDGVKTELTSKLEDYLDDVENIVSYAKVLDLILNCSGVSDVTSTTVNGGTSNITLSGTQYAIVGDITINA